MKTLVTIVNLNKALSIINTPNKTKKGFKISSS